jgi:hypothetical protein
MQKRGNLRYDGMYACENVARRRVGGGSEYGANAAKRGNLRYDGACTCENVARHKRVVSVVAKTWQTTR